MMTLGTRKRLKKLMRRHCFIVTNDNSLKEIFAILLNSIQWKRKSNKLAHFTLQYEWLTYIRS